MKLISDLGLQYANENNTGQRYRYGLYECENCNAVVKKHIRFIQTNTCRKCSNTKNATIHGFGGNRIRNAYNKMLSRCYSENNKDYKYYGAKGITVCEEWRNDFKSFYDWSISNGYDDGLQLDKDILCESLSIYPKIYSPNTCMWVTKSENIKEKNNRSKK